MQQQACEFLQELTNKISEQKCRSFMYDELAGAIPKVKPEVVQFIAENFVEKFRSLYLISESEMTSQDESPTPEDRTHWMGLKSNLDFQIAIGKLAFSDDKTEQESLLCLPPYFRLLQRCEIVTNPEEPLEGIEIMLLCPIQMFKKYLASTISSSSDKAEKSSIIISLFHANNW